MQIKFEKLLRPLDEDEFKRLESSCLKSGIRDPLVLWGDVLLDGHNRYRIANKYNLDYKTEQVELESESEARKWIINNQLGRRNLTPVEVAYFQGLRYKEEKKEQGGDVSKRQNVALKLADEFGVSDRTVERNAKFAEALDKVTETEGEEYRCKALKGEISKKDVISKVKKINREREKDIQSEIGKPIELELDFRLGDFEKVFGDLGDGSVDLILTDPPYPREYLPEWSKLSKFASRVLKPGGFCIAYSGQLNLIESMNRLNEHLDYYWMFSLLHAGSHQLIFPRNVFCGWKPLLVFQNGFSKRKVKIEDVINGSGMEKKYHAWQQGEGELVEIIAAFTENCDTILDPFAGSGTTLIVAHNLDRVAMGAEIDERTYNIAKARIDERIEWR